MPAFGFQDRFVEPILSGDKISTIRPVRKDRRLPCKPDDALSFWTDWRTKNAKKFATAVTVSVDHIVIWNRSCAGFYDPAQETSCDLKLDYVAWLEGFPSVDAFMNFFEEKYGLPFLGVHIAFECVCLVR